MTTRPGNLDRLAFNALTGDAPLTGIRVNPGHIDGVPLWECPCRECTRLDWTASENVRADHHHYQSLKDFRYEQFPDIYPCPV